MIIPSSSRKKALVIVDVQRDFLNKENEYVVDNIIRLIQNTNYDMYIEAVFYTKPDSIWENQINYQCPKSKNTSSVMKIEESIKELNFIKIEKQTKSIFKWNFDIIKELKDNKIKELHFVWLETHDCILASVYESFDLGFFSYIIEECCGWANLKLHKEWIDIMRKVGLTNNSIIEDINVVDI